MANQVFIAALLPLCLGQAAVLAQDAGQDDVKRLQGEWKFVAVEMEGKAINFNNTPVWKARRYVFSGAEITLTPGQVGSVGRKKVFTVDVSKQPKAMDITPTDGNEAGMTTACIYELSQDDLGRDRLKICIPYFYNKVDPKQRPTEFKTKDNDGLMLYILERVEDK